MGLVLLAEQCGTHVYLRFFQMLLGFCHLVLRRRSSKVRDGPCCRVESCPLLLPYCWVSESCMLCLVISLTYLQPKIKHLKPDLDFCSPNNLYAIGSKVCMVPDVLI